MTPCLTFYPTYDWELAFHIQRERERVHWKKLRPKYGVDKNICWIASVMDHLYRCKMKYLPTYVLRPPKLRARTFLSSATEPCTEHRQEKKEGWKSCINCIIQNSETSRYINQRKMVSRRWFGNSIFNRDITTISFSQFQYILLFSRQGKLRLQRWYSAISQKDKKKITRELISTVLSRKPKMCSFLEYKDLKVVYKR